ncbi:hypothetical protein GOP47_0009944 [Adiantum capillus-veneris]|uniref:Alpha/beta hydrolase fold-3 domain-containing protein n=1 Tax=Adiantum capillus-veneris TaxID=13818 RepID=A0A9D4UXJ9_ADICA|nr:hypothetical protein GOP47_0009944 [Adiantum capillus-veneris]
MADAGKEVEVDMSPFLCVYKDGSVCRNEIQPLLPPSPEPGVDGASKDITLNEGLGLWARLFLPSYPPPSHKPRLSIVLYFHGGGFLFGSPAWSNFHFFCSEMAKLSSSICISASYRLAPEHRLPTSIDDGFSALQWLHSQALLQGEGKHELMDPWLVNADFSKCFIAGESAGGALAHHVTTRAFNKPLSSASWEPMCIRGMILIHPGFMKSTRTQEELDCYQDDLMNWALADSCFTLVLPVGSSKDNPYFNPLPAITCRDSVFVLPKALVTLADNDALHFVGLEYVRALKDAGCHVDMVMAHGVGHVFFIAQPDSEQAQVMMQRITKFIAEEDKPL